MAREVICGIYKVINPLGLIYIGQSEHCLRRYARTSYRFQKLIHESILLHGFENHKFEIIERCAIDDLDDRETFWIAFYDTCNPEKGLNSNTGGKKKGFKMTNSVKERMSESKMGHTVPEATLNALMLRNAGNKYSLGRIHSEETKKKIGDGNKGKIISIEQRLKTGLHLKKIVLNLENGIYYDSLTDAYKCYTFKKAITYSALRAQLRGQNKNYTSLIYA